MPVISSAMVCFSYKFSWVNNYRLLGFRTSWKYWLNLTMRTCNDVCSNQAITASDATAGRGPPMTGGQADLATVRVRLPMAAVTL